MSSVCTRRDFLRRSGSALAALALPSLRDSGWNPPLPPDDLISRSQQGLGRVTEARIKVRAAPDHTAEAIGHRVMDELISLFGTAQGPSELAHNPVWFKTNGGYVHSAFIQPVSRRLNWPLRPSQVSGERPALLEVTVPYSDVFRELNAEEEKIWRLYYATTHWAVAVERDEARRRWYKLRNDRGNGFYYARAEHLRPYKPAELVPISPGVPDKRIEVNLTKQHLTAYEGKQAVLTTRVSTGTVIDSSDGVDRDYRTPEGTFHVLKKRASRHMQGGTPGADYYDLPGVPWVTYFTWNGVALHGAYWHNDYGRQRTHGCVNLTPKLARWLYLWTEPAVPAGAEVLQRVGTTIHVFA